jgi:hypothetical protein
VEYFEEPGTLYYFKYMLADPSGEAGEVNPYIPVATTRPETILGDTAVQSIPKTRATGNILAEKSLCPSWAGASRSSLTSMWTASLAQAPQDHARSRCQRLRHRPTS